MKTKNYSAFAVGEKSLTIALSVPESSSEFNILAKAKPGEDPCNDVATDYAVFHGCLADFRYWFAEEFQKHIIAEFPDHPALKRKTKTKKTKEGSTEVYDEPEVTYFRRALAELAALRGVELVEADAFQSIADKVMALNETNDEGKELLFLEDGTITEDPALGKPRKLVFFDPTQRERSERGPKKLPAVYRAAAEGIFNAGRVEAFCTKNSFTLNIPEEVASDEVKVKELTIEQIGWKIKSLEDAERAKIDLSNKYA